MKKKSIYLFLFLLAHIYITYAQQIITDNSQQPNELIQNLVGDNCATASNVSSDINGSVNNIISYGSFDRGTSNFPLQSGIVLSTGNVISAGNTFISEGLSEGEINWNTDADIQDVLGINQTLNATSIEFDFVSANGIVAFKYLFASDEYQQEYPCDFKDVFAILIKKAGTTDPYVNIALVPETNSEVSTNTIHPNINGFCDAQNEDFFQGYNLGHTNFNGNTTVLTAASVIIPNETYNIKFVIADYIDERYDSAVFIEAEGFGSSIDLGPDLTACGSTVVLDGTIDNNQATYKWFKDAIEIAGETNPTLPVLEYGVYVVEVTIPLSNGFCTMTDSVTVDTIPFQQAEPISDILVCDEIPYDGVGIFDLTTKNDEIMQNLPSPNFVISYHLSQNEALDGLNPIIGDYENTGQSETIYVRIESLDGSCLQLGTFNVEVGVQPNYIIIPPIVVCSDTIVNGVAYFELSYHAFEIANYEFNRTVTFHITEDDAYSGTNSITYATDVPFGSNYTYARIVNDFTGCLKVIPIQVVIQDGIDYNQDLFIDLCLPPNESTAIFDLEPLRNEVLAEIPDAGVLFYTSYDNAEDGSLPIFGFLYQSEVPYLHTIYMGVRLLNPPCTTILEVDLHTNLAFNIVNKRSTINRCDKGINDNILDFDLIDVSYELAGGYDINITYYNTEEDRLNGNNPINQNVPYTVTSPTKTLYTVVSHNGCENDINITLKINPSPEAQSEIIEYCGNPNIEGGFTTIQLNPLINTITGNYEDSTITLYATEEDALFGENNIQNSYDIIGDNPILYFRVTNNTTQCYDISTLQVNITDGIAIATPDPIIICDEDLDGIATVNLESIFPQLSNDLSSVNISFYDNYEDAVSDRLPITNPGNYTTRNTEIYIRADIQGLDCFVVVSFEVLIYISPQLNTISDYINCEIDSNADSSFFFVNKDPEIINNQTGMQVLYFENETDAINRQNPIDKIQAYVNTSNQQVIYYRIENEQESSCYKIAPMQIEVRQAPVYTEPTDIYECDYNGNGLNTVNFNEKINEITNGAFQDFNVTFHLTPLNASIGTNPLPLNYTTTINPQLIHARVENSATSCYSVSTFKINTLALPEVNYGQSIINCANNYVFEQQWNLTDIEPLILKGRQYGLEFSYFESETDLISNINQISNPENFTNSDSPQTLFVKVRNVNTDCFSTVPFSLVLNSPPPINAIETFNTCENSDNSVNLLDISEVLFDNTYNVLVSYHSSQIDADANENALNTNYYYTSNIESLFVRAEYNTTHCYATYQFQLVINPLPIAYQPSDLIACDDDFDSILSFDLSQQNAAILNGQNPNDFSVSYFNSEFNVNENTQPLNTNYFAFDGEIIYVRIENNITGCFDITQFAIVVNPLPFTVIEDQVICLNNLPLLVSAYTNNPADTYLWSTNTTSQEIEIYETGTYSVTITNELGCEYTSSFNVSESESAIIDVVETIDFSDPNNITITVTGIGNYLFQLNGGPFQSSNVFQNVPIGYNTIIIIDENGCAQITREVLVIDAPKHLTPNDDGDFDTWHIAGVETLPGTIIYIFDRHGKILTELNYNSLGWDGTYNGNKMPSADYWFVAAVVQNGKTFEVKGHFTLRR